MKRSDFIKALAAIVAAPSVLISATETVTTAAKASTTAVAIPHMNGVSWKIVDDMILDTEWMTFMLTDPRSDLWQKAAAHGIDMSKPHEMQVGFDRDDFARGLQTIVIRQPSEDPPDRPTTKQNKKKWKEALRS